MSYEDLDSDQDTAASEQEPSCKRAAVQTRSCSRGHSARAYPKASGPGPTTLRRQKTSAGAESGSPIPAVSSNSAHVQNPVVDYPAGSWIWVKFVDADPILRRRFNDFYAAKAGDPVATGKLTVYWAD